jgi:orotate phosphoribosyltransferase
VTKGGRVKETIEIVHANGGYVVGVAAVVDRSNGEVKFGVPFVSLLSMDVETFEPDKIPLDLKGLPAVKPGSK